MARTANAGRVRVAFEVRDRSFLHGSGSGGLTCGSRWPVWFLVVAACNGAAVSARGFNRHRRGTPPDAGLAHRFEDAGDTDWYRPDLLPISGGIMSSPVRLVPAVVFSQRSSLDGLSCRKFWQGSAAFQRQHHDRDRGPHLYELVAVLAFLVVRSGSVRQARDGRGRGGGVSGQSAGVVAGACGARHPLRDFHREAARTHS